MDNLMEKVQEAFAAAFDIDPRTVTPDSTPAQIPAWDSMGHVVLVSHLERVLGLSFDVDEVMEMENVRRILQLASSKLGKG